MKKEMERKMRRGMRTGMKYAVAAMAAVSMAVTGCAGSGTGNSAKDSGISAAADSAGSSAGNRAGDIAGDSAGNRAENSAGKGAGETGNNGTRDDVVVVMGPTSEPEAGFDPAYGWGAGEHVHEPLIQSTLTVTTADLKIGYDLATSMEVSQDGLTWTVNETPLLHLALYHGNCRYCTGTCLWGGLRFTSHWIRQIYHETVG